MACDLSALIDATFPEGIRLVASRTRFSDSFASGATYTKSMSRTSHRARGDLTSIQLVFPNWYVSTSETGAGSSATITASVEYPAGVFTQVKFSTSTSGSITSGAELISDALTVAIPDGAQFWVRSYYVCSSGVIFSSQSDKSAGEAANFHVSTLTDQTMSGSIVDIGSGGVYGPCAIIGTTTQPAVGVVGDSIGYGVGDRYDPDGFIGLFERAIAPFAAMINGSRGGDTATAYIASHTRRAAILNAYCTHIIVQLGINDLAASRTAAQLTADQTTIAGYFSGKTIWNTTMTPAATSTDNWKTLANQTTVAWNAARLTFNGNVRALISGFGGYFEIADVLESARNSGLWRVDGTRYGFTYDGTHPSPSGYRRQASGGSIVISTFLGIQRQPLLPASQEDVKLRKRGKVLTADLLTSIFAQVASGPRQMLDNGDFLINQRGHSGTVSVGAATVVGPDRWGIQRSGLVTGAQFSIQAGTIGKPNALRVQRASGNSSTATIIASQSLTTKDSARAIGGIVTVSGIYNTGADFSGGAVFADLCMGTGTDELVTSGSVTGFTQLGSVSFLPNLDVGEFSFSALVPPAATQLFLRLYYAPTGTAGANDWFQVTDVQQEGGAFKTPYERLDFHRSLDRCLPYYEKSFLYATAPAQAAGYAGAFTWSQTVGAAATMAGMWIPYKKTKHSNPTRTFYSPQSAAATPYNTTIGAAGGALSDTGASNVGGMSLTFTTAAGSAAGNLNAIHWTADTGFF